jgi:hypothetical protein
MADYNVQPGILQVAKLTGANMNSTADQAFTITHPYAKFRLHSIWVHSASISLTTAVGGIYTGTGKTGAVCSTTQVYSSLTTARKTLSISVTDTDLYGSGAGVSLTLYLSLTTAQGAAATADFYIFGANYEF